MTAMRSNDIKKILKAEPFVPIRLGLSDGRSVIIRHPDQAVVTDRKMFMGLAKVTRSTGLRTPASGDTFAKDWMFIDLLHIVSIEPDEGSNGNGQKRKRSGKR
jgi:hypothetical protein